MSIINCKYCEERVDTDTHAEHEDECREEQPYSIVWDLETTGFVAPAAKILEIGCFIIRGDEVERKHWVLDNKVEIPERIVEITGITQEIIDKEGRDPKECLDEFLPLFKDCEQNITHNGVKFDINFLVNYAADVLGWNTEQKETVRSLIRLTAYDTAVHFKAKKLDMSRMDREHFINFAERVMEVRAYGVHFNLGLCIEECGIELDLVQHRAMADVELTHALYKHIHHVCCDGECHHDDCCGKVEANCPHFNSDAVS